MSDITLFHEDLLNIYDAADKPNCFLFIYVKMAKELVKECEAKQAQIDALMLEYCPDEMTTEQIDNWEKHQKPATL